MFTDSQEKTNKHTTWGLQCWGLLYTPENATAEMKEKKNDFSHGKKLKIENIPGMWYVGIYWLFSVQIKINRKVKSILRGLC